MSAYTVQQGDTFESISILQYGVPDGAARIQQANPQAGGGLAAGMSLVIPAIDPPPRIAEAPSRGPTDVSVSIDGAPFTGWDSVELTHALDAVDSFSLSSVFEPDSQRHRDAFRPFGFQRAEVSIGGEPDFSGTVMGVGPEVSADSRVVSLQGYALAGVLADVTLPPGVPLEYRGLDLNGITTEMAKPFGLVPVFESPPGDVFEHASIAQAGKVWAFWTRLAQQRGLLIASDAQGQPLFRSPTAGPSVQTLIEGEAGVSKVVPAFDAQTYYSTVSAVTPSFFGFGGGVQTVTNPHLTGVLRPLTFTAEDTEGAGGLAAAGAKLGRMFANAIAYEVTVPTWQDSSGARWNPGSVVTLLAPGAMVYTETDFQIRRVTLVQSRKGDVATLSLVLPGSFEGTIPEVLPWD